MASSMRLVNGHPCPAHLGPNGYGYATPSLLSLKNLLLCSNTPVDDYRRPCAVTPEEEFLLTMLFYHTGDACWVEGSPGLPCGTIQVVLSKDPITRSSS